MGERCDAQPLGALGALGEQAKGDALAGAGLAGDEGEAALAYQMLLDAAAEALDSRGGHEAVERQVGGERVPLQAIEGEQLAIHQRSPCSPSVPGPGRSV